MIRARNIFAFRDAVAAVVASSPSAVAPAEGYLIVKPSFGLYSTARAGPRVTQTVARCTRASSRGRFHLTQPLSVSRGHPHASPPRAFTAPQPPCASVAEVTFDPPRPFARGRIPTG